MPPAWRARPGPAAVLGDVGVVSLRCCRVVSRFRGGDLGGEGI